MLRDPILDDDVSVQPRAAAAATVCASVGFVQAAEATVTAAETGAPLRCMSMRTGEDVFLTFSLYAHTGSYIFTSSMQCLFPARRPNKTFETKTITRQKTLSIV